MIRNFGWPVNPAPAVPAGRLGYQAQSGPVVQIAAHGQGPSTGHASSRPGRKRTKCW